MGGKNGRPANSLFDPLANLHKTIFRKMKEVYFTFLTAISFQQ